MNILFLCTSNIYRSKTAEDYFSKINSEHCYKSAGLNEDLCTKAGSVVCNKKLLSWADKIYVMEERHIERIRQHTQNEFLSKIINLNIDDIYAYMDECLIAALEAKVQLP